VRSVSGFNVYDALQACSEYIIQFGGHKYAAGLTIDENQLDAFKQKFESVVKQTISPESLTPEIQIDTPILFKEINPEKENIPKFFRILRQMAPFGPGNMNPVFLTEGVNDTGGSKAVGKDNAHLKLSVKEFKSGIVMNGIGFNLGDKISLVKSGVPLAIVYTLEENNWKGNKTMQLRIKDIKSLIDL
jgi:single-stranded-DNA-specific exonuclease